MYSTAMCDDAPARPASKSVRPICLSHATVPIGSFLLQTNIKLALGRL